MSTWIKAIGIALIITTAAYFISTNTVFKPKKKRMDVRMQVFVLPNETTTGYENNDIFKKIDKTITNRFEALGYKNKIKQIEKNKLSIDVENITDEDSLYIQKVVIQSAKLDFWEMYTIENLNGAIAKMDELTMKLFPPPATDTVTKKEINTDSTISPEVQQLLSNIEEDEMLTKLEPYRITSLIKFIEPVETPNGPTQFLPLIGIVNISDSAKVNKILLHPELANFLPTDIRFLYGDSEAYEKSAKGKKLSLYAVRTKGMKTAKVGNKHIKTASVDFDVNGKPTVNLTFTATGTKLWEKLTQENIGRPIAICLDDYVLAAPNVTAAITGGSSIISGGFTIEETEILANNLKADPLPADMSISQIQYTPIKAKANPGLYIALALAFLISLLLSWFILNILKNK